MRCRLPTALPYTVRSIDNHTEKYDVRNTCVTTLKMNAEKWFRRRRELYRLRRNRETRQEAEERWKRNREYSRRRNARQRPGTQFYNREGRISMLISNMWLDLYLLGGLVPRPLFFWWSDSPTIKKSGLGMRPQANFLKNSVKNFYNLSVFYAHLDKTTY